MRKNPFNPKQQETDLGSKVVSGLERISEVFKVLLWEKAKLVGLSPIQIQLLIFIKYHDQSLCNVSHLAKEFNVTKPTVSDAIRVLDKKGLISKDYSSEDSRSYSIVVSNSGKNTVLEIEDFANPLHTQLDGFTKKELESFFSILNQLIFRLSRQGILSVQRTCYACKFYRKNKGSDYCDLLVKPLLKGDIRLDCMEFESSS